MVLLSRSAIDIEHLSWLNNVALIATGISRAVGSLFIGTLYSWGLGLGYVVIPWCGLATIAGLGVLLVFFIKESETDG